MHAGRITGGAVLFPAMALLFALAFALAGPRFAQLPASVAFAPPSVAAILLIGTVFATLQYAEIVGARLGQPLGTLVLTIAVTIIEVSIMASMIEHGSDDPTEAREAVFSAIMIVCNGLVGICLVIGGFRHREQAINPMSTQAYLAVLISLSVLTLVLPDYTKSTAGPTLTPSQLAFISALSVFLYCAFLFIQTVRHRAYFLDDIENHPVERPTVRRMVVALAGLGASLVGVSLLAGHVAGSLEDGLRAVGVEDVNAVTGAAIAMLVLLPESLNAVRAAARNAVQTSLNGALGSVLATIGLTVPTVAVMSIWKDQDIAFGLDPRDVTMLSLTLLLSVVSFGAGRSNVLTGLVHLVVFATYLFLLFVP